MSKQSFDLKKWLWIGGIPVAAGALIMFSRVVVTFADMPNRVNNIEQYITAQQTANEIQAKANELLQEQIKQQNQQQPQQYQEQYQQAEQAQQLQQYQQPQQPPCEWYNQIYYCWDYQSQTWIQQQTN